MPSSSSPAPSGRPTGSDDTPAPPVGAPDLAVLGPVLLRGPGGMVAPAGPRSRALLVALALAAGRPVSSAHLLDDLWWDRGEQGDLADPRAALQTVVSRTRRIGAEGLLASSPSGYAFVGSSDLTRARAAAREAASALAAGRPDAALAAVDDALALWRGEPGADLAPGSPLAESLGAEAGRVRSTLQDVRLDALVSAGDDEGVLAVAGDRLAHRPADEAACLAFMTAAARSGRQADALRAFATLREALADELGADPSADVVRLHEHVLRGEVPAAAARAAHPTAPAIAPPTVAVTSAGPGTPEDAAPRRSVLVLGLRTPPNALVGRDADVAAIEVALRTSRLVTVLGPGGLGKTRVAQEVAHRAADAGAPVVVVELASVRTDDDVELALATRLGVGDGQGSTRLGDQLGRTDLRSRILDRLRTPATLLVLDNCEHVLDGAARWTADVLAETSARVLTTSRAPLELTAEAVFPLPPLASRRAVGDGGSASTPGPVGTGAGGASGPAALLFEQRARAARPDVDLPADVVERLCDRLDGLPLAIELAAARTRSMSVVEIERRLASRFALLTSGDRAAPERHRTLRAVIAWSWNLLGGAEQALLRRLCVLPGAFDAATAEQVTAACDGPDAGFATFDQLDALVSQSMLVAVDDRIAGTTRYRMLETVREFAALELERSGEQDAVRDAVHAWARDLARTLQGRLVGAAQVDAVRRGRVEQENLVQVLRWALADRRRDVLLPVFAFLARLWMLRSQFGETVTLGFEVARALVGREPADDEVGDLVWVLAAAGSPMSALTDQAEGMRSFARLRRLLRRPELLTPGQLATARLLDATLDPPRVPVVLADLRESDDWYVSLVAYLMSAQLAENQGRLAESLVQSRRAHTIATAHEETWGAAMAAQHLAELAAEEGDPAESLRWIAVAREGFEAVDAEAFLLQLDNLETTMMVATGRGAEVLPALHRLAATPLDEHDGRDEGPGGPSERRMVGASGLAHEAAGRGDLEAALRTLTEILDELKGQRFGALQSRVSTGASRLALAALDAAEAGLEERTPVASAEQLEVWTREQRAVTRALLRSLPGFVDRPVLGSSAAALGASLWARPELGRVADGVELLALAGRLASRQDVLALRRARHRDLAVRVAGEDVVRAGEERAAAVEDPTARVREIIDDGPWRRV
ncbi:AfsR/SARP family transcriptional regulator [Luteimicrobium subarcticum]|uniref:AfsR/SARP family transcriptional regulator n=1 Tax=Luteimicrobium subarcticum TaxID=620910 RepID=UPI0012FD5796|nr:BTAD domain-containing putative transcriptional regulator [Luteimicrobium subarcticum]